VCRLLNGHRVRYLVAGGVAANLHGSVRATKDVDVLVPPDVANMERLIAPLSKLPWRVAEELDAGDLVRKPITVLAGGQGRTRGLPSTKRAKTPFIVPIVFERRFGNSRLSSCDGGPNQAPLGTALVAGCVNWHR
jgi:hypothetical protein